MLSWTRGVGRSRCPLLEEVVEEALLQLTPVRRVEVGPVGVTVCLEPLVLGGSFDKTVEVAPRVDALTTPVRRREEGHGDPGQVHGALAVPVVEEGVALDLRERLLSVCHQLVFREGDGAGHRLAGVGIDRGPLTLAVLDRVDLALLPSSGELAEDAAVVVGVAIGVGEALPSDQGGQVLGLALRRGPSHDRVVGDAEDADPSRCSRAGSPPIPLSSRCRRTRAGYGARAHPATTRLPGSRPGPGRSREAPSRSGSVTSQAWCLLVEPSRTLGSLATSLSHCIL